MESILKQHGFSPEEICIIRWQLNDYGGFYNSLMETIARADWMNRERLKLAFPVEVYAVNQFKALPPEGEPDFYSKIKLKLNEIPQYRGRF